MRAARLLLVAIGLTICTPAAADSPAWAMPVIAEALAAHAHGDFRLARRDFRRLAAQGSAIAETMLGAMAAHGQGAPRDPATAAMWWLRAANRGYAPAQLALAGAFAQGAGVQRDRHAAWVWARLAATHGDAVTAARAASFAQRLAAGLAPDTLLALDERRLAWRPWATLPD